MNKIAASIVLLLLSTTISVAQVISFEKQYPETWKASSGSKLSVSDLYYKDGESSLMWNYKEGSTIDISVEPILLDEKTEGKYGITLWIYNEVPINDSICFKFKSSGDKSSYWFAYHLNYKGWRACWIAFEYMQGDKREKKINAIQVAAPNTKSGRVFFDRMKFPERKMNARTTPDAQMPTNNSLASRDLWHWCRVWEWEQYRYDLPLCAKLSAKQLKELKTIEERLDDFVREETPKKKAISNAYKLFERAAITSSGKGFTGAPLVMVDEQNKKRGELSLYDLETMLSGFAYDSYYNGSAEAYKNYFLVWNYALDQGFAYGSGIGTNHHYGYQVRKIYSTAWLMRKEICKQSNRDEILSALTFWSAIQETRLSYQYGRDELLDSWHTLTMPKIISVMMMQDNREKERALRSLSRWISSSLEYTPGTIGGIKVDGTTFHHGGFYPGYTSGVLACIGQYIALTNQTDYELSFESRQHLKQALLAMRNYTNGNEWGIALGGRHPFSGSMKEDDIESFASLALAGDLEQKGNPFDYSLAADYLRLQPKNTPMAKFFKKQGVEASSAPQGFFVYNYGSAGIYRRNNWMVTLKGYNTDVWGSEIYKKDNRYGRYQSYGSAQIIGEQGRIASGYEEDGWDWNRLPGTTTIHLSLDLLESPLPGTLMAHSKENFAGTCSFENKNGMFAMKLMERSYKNFTPDFIARKSVFCFENRLICVGTGISNSNATYPTETTLFQSTFNENQSPIHVDGKEINTAPYENIITIEKSHVVRDGYDNYYFIPQGELHIQVAEQQSRDNKVKAETKGMFAVAYLNHGTTPKEKEYEYMVLIQPTEEELIRAKQGGIYEISKSNVIHRVHDKLTDIIAYAIFEPYHSTDDSLLISASSEMMLMSKRVGKDILTLSLCDPNLNIAEKAYTTKEPSRVIEKEITLKGLWQLKVDNQQVKISHSAGNTLVKVSFCNGRPVEIQLAIL
ncbi:MAG: chondroitinase family polysaccharide lyase [Bacteroidaceae bacterium]